MKIFMEKWNIKDGFWRLNCALGEEWNFTYILTQEKGEQVRLVVPTSLKMRCIESPSYFCAVSVTARYLSHQYVKTPVGTLTNHNFSKIPPKERNLSHCPRLEVTISTTLSSVLSMIIFLLLSLHHSNN